MSADNEHTDRKITNHDNKGNDASELRNGQGGCYDFQLGSWVLLSTDRLVLAAGLTGPDKFQGLVGLHQAGGRKNVGVSSAN